MSTPPFPPTYPARLGRRVTVVFLVLAALITTGVLVHVIQESGSTPELSPTDLFLALAALLLLPFFWLIHHWVIAPVNHMMECLIDQQKNGPTTDNRLDDSLPTELGQIAYWFNRNNAAMQDAIDHALHASTAKSDFLAHMSHELRTPLNSIIGMTQLLEQQKLNQETKELFAIMAQSCHALLHIVNDILDLSKIEAGQVILEQRPFDLGASLQQTIQSLLPLASQKGLRLEWHVPPDLPFVIGDAFRLSRILTNLIGNAIRYTDRGWIKVDVAATSPMPEKIELTVRVQDSGIGIAQEKLGTIFDRYTQADASTTREYGGTGLGLTITKQLTELMQGHLGVESSLGVGSTFWFEIPFEIAPHAAIDTQAINTVLNELNGLGRLTADTIKILVADDHAMNQEFIRRLFKNLGIAHYQIVDNGMDVLAALEQEPFDLILMDCHMPRMDGYQTTQIIRALADPVLRSTPIIAMTANAMPEDEERCRAIGMNAYLTKPIIVHDFIKKMSDWVYLNPWDRNKS